MAVAGRGHPRGPSATGFFGGAIGDDPSHTRPIEILILVLGLRPAGEDRHSVPRADEARHEVAVDVSGAADDENIYADDEIKQ